MATKITFYISHAIALQKLRKHKGDTNSARPILLSQMTVVQLVYSVLQKLSKQVFTTYLIADCAEFSEDYKRI